MTKLINRDEFIRAKARQTKADLIKILEKETGEDMTPYLDLSNLDLAAKIADLKGYPSTSGQEAEEAEIKYDDPISDPPVTAEELAATRAAVVEKLLAELKVEKTQSGRKRIRASLRAHGYRLSDHREPKPEPTSKIESDAEAFSKSKSRRSAKAQTAKNKKK